MALCSDQDLQWLRALPANCQERPRSLFGERNVTLPLAPPPRMELALRRLRFLLLWGLRLTPHQLHRSSARSEPAYALSTAAVALALVCRTYLVARTAPCLCLRATVHLRLHRQSCLNLHFHRSSARSTPACTFSIAVVAPALRVCVVLFCRKSFPARTAPCLSMFASVHLRRYLQNRPHLHLHLHPHLYIQQHRQMSRQ